MGIDQVLIILGFFAFCVGLIDADVVGGGLVQLPALMHALPHTVWRECLAPISLLYWQGLALH